MADAGLIVAGVALAGTMFASFTTYKASKNATRVGLESNAFQRAVAAEEKMDVAEKKVEALDRRLRTTESTMVGLESRLRYIILLIHDPYISLEMLRERVPLNFNTSRRDDE